MPRSLRRLSTVAQTVLMIVALAGAALLFVPRLLGWQVDTVLSGSMTPTYPVQSVLFVKPVSPATIKVGEVITFGTGAGNPTPTSHRVVAIQGTGGQLQFVTKGDANEDADPNPVTASAVRGRVVFGIPVLGRFVRAVHQPLGFSLLLVLPALVLMTGQVRELARSRRSTPPILEGNAA